MKAVAALIVLGGAFFLYLHLHGGKSAALPGYHQSHYQPAGPNTYLPDSRHMTAAQLEKLLDTETLHWAPSRLVHMRCKKRPHTNWDYVCSDAYLRVTFGVDVDKVGVTNFHLLSPKRP